MLTHRATTSPRGASTRPPPQPRSSTATDLVVLPVTRPAGGVPRKAFCGV